MSEFHIYVQDELFRNIEGITSRKMFGGYGFYKDDVMFAIVTHDVLYFKVDDVTKPDYEKHNSKPFTYDRKDGKETTISFWEVPVLVMDDTTLMPKWVDAAVSAALRAKQHKK